MISRAYAEKLKELGVDFTPLTTANRDQVYYPSLSQLLAMIEAEGYWWLLRRGMCVIGEGKKVGDNVPGVKFDADVTEDACAMALIWIKEGKREKEYTKGE